MPLWRGAATSQKADRQLDTAVRLITSGPRSSACCGNFSFFFFFLELFPFCRQMYSFKKELEATSKCAFSKGNLNAWGRQNWQESVYICRNLWEVAGIYGRLWESAASDLSQTLVSWNLNDTETQKMPNHSNIWWPKQASNIPINLENTQPQEKSVGENMQAASLAANALPATTLVAVVFPHLPLMGCRSLLDESVVCPWHSETKQKEHLNLSWVCEFGTDSLWSAC